MENTQSQHEDNIKKIAENLEFQKKQQETKGVVQLILLPVWIYLIYQIIC
jgi:hypothetical protein